MMHSLFILTLFTRLARAQFQYDTIKASWVPSSANEAARIVIKLLVGLWILATVALFFAIRRHNHGNESLQTLPPAIRIQEATRQYYERMHMKSGKAKIIQAEKMKDANAKPCLGV